VISVAACADGASIADARTAGNPNISALAKRLFRTIFIPAPFASMSKRTTRD
jgi:hypothetical protein